MSDKFIRFNRPSAVGREVEYIKQAIANGQLSGDGPFSKRCHEWLEDRFGVEKALLTHSCTAALEMSALLADIEPDDEVILPSYTFVSTANAFVLRGARLRFVDIRRDTKNMDETQVERLITDKTKAIVPVHYAGISCEMDAIMALAENYGLVVIEDAAQAIFSTYKGRPLGSIGHFGCFSFHGTKNLVAGEGGALLVNDVQFGDRAEIIREKGTNRTQFFRNVVNKYTWVDAGSSYLPSELVAAFLFAQFEEWEAIQERRMAIWNRYRDELEELAIAGKIELPHVPADCSHNAHMFYIMLPTAAQRTALIEGLLNAGVRAVFHYIPLHSSPMGLQHTLAEQEPLPVTDLVAARLLRLPIYNDFSEEQQGYVIDHVKKFFGQA